jgi:hypothetical protein
MSVGLWQEKTLRARSSSSDAVPRGFTSLCARSVRLCLPPGRLCFVCWSRWRKLRSSRIQRHWPVSVKAAQKDPAGTLPALGGSCIVKCALARGKTHGNGTPSRLSGNCGCWAGGKESPSPRPLWSSRTLPLLAAWRGTSFGNRRAAEARALAMFMPREAREGKPRRASV